MSEPLWLRDPDAAIEARRKGQAWGDMYLGGCASVVVRVVLLLAVVGGLVALFR